jgi:hypothetical protein
MTAQVDISPETIERMASNYADSGLPALADTLRALRLSLTASEKRWTACVDEMPKNGPYLCYLKGAKSSHVGGDLAFGREGIYIIWHSTDIGAAQNREGWYWDHMKAALEWIDADYADVTHWMRLPGSPI